MADEDLFLLSRSEIKSLTDWDDVVVDDYLAISQSVEGILRPEGWIDVTANGTGNLYDFQNSWVNYGSGYAPAAFYKDGGGRVHVKGLVKTGSGVVFTLPEGYRPTDDEIFACIGNGAIARVDVNSNGDVDVVSGSAVWTSLSLSFRAEQ